MVKANLPKGVTPPPRKEPEPQERAPVAPEAAVEPPFKRIKMEFTGPDVPPDASVLDVIAGGVGLPVAPDEASALDVMTGAVGAMPEDPSALDLLAGGAANEQSALDLLAGGTGTMAVKPQSQPLMGVKADLAEGAANEQSALDLLAG